MSQRQYQAVLDEGFTAFAVRHGSRPKFIIPKIVPDMRRAVRYDRLNARRLRVDLNRLGARGGSAGGHLSLMLENTSDGGDPSSEGPVLRMSNRVAAMVAYCPPVDLRLLARGVSPEITNTRFPALNFDRSEGSAYLPFVHVSADDRPTLLVHGDSDGLVNVSNSHEMYAALQEHGVESKVIIIAGADHGFHGADAVRAIAAMVDWFVERPASRPSNEQADDTERSGLLPRPLGRGPG